VTGKYLSQEKYFHTIS